MRRYLRSITIICLTTVLFSACSKIPDHAKYIPKDAIVVAGVNLKSLGKKIAWNVLTGSKLFKEMEQRMPDKNAKDAMGGLEHAGIDGANTFYVYVKTDKRFTGGNRVTALVPLSDAGEWEAFVKKTFPNATIKQHGDRKEASLAKGMYAGWNSKLMIVINVLPNPADYYNPQAMMTQSTGDSTAPAPSQVDDNTMAAEMDNAFGVTKENSIIENKRFTELEGEGHDISFWMNYDVLVSQYMSENMSEKMGGLSISSALWKDAAAASGIDFKQGKITGDSKYYMSDELKDICKELGGTNADKDMIQRMPSQNMDMMMAFHLSPKGLKAILEKTGMLGYANIALMTQNINADYVLDAFTGDMAISVNDLSMKSEMRTDSMNGVAFSHADMKPSLSVTYTLKINKKENFNKLFGMLNESGMLQPMGANTYVFPMGEHDSAYVMINDQYAVVSNKQAYASGFLAGTFKSQKMTDAASSTINDHVFSWFLDVQQAAKGIDPGITQSAHDSVILAESKKLLSNVSFSGGAFKGNAFEYHMEINFMNTEENSIIQLLDFGMKINDATKTGN